MFSGGDISSNSQFFYTGIRQSLAGHIENTGWLFGALYGTGAYHYQNSTIPGGRVDASFSVIDAAIGYQYRLENGAIAVLAGLHGEDHSLSANDPTNRVQGQSFGVSGQFDYWTKPDPDIIFTAYGSVTSVFGGYYGRVFTGYRVPLLKNAFVGPELALMGNEAYWEMRLGAQIHSLTIGLWGVSGSFGLSQNQDARRSLYGSFSMWRQFDLQRFIKIGNI